MVAEWFCQVMGSEVGPLTQRQLVDMVRQHQVNPEDLVRRKTSAWVPAFQVKGLFEAAEKPATPEPPAAETDSTPSSEAIEPSTTKGASTRDPKVEALEAVSKPVDTIRRIDKSEDANTKQDWFCIASGEKKGPLGFAELKALAQSGTLRSRDRVWRASWPKFQKACDVDGLPVSE